MPRSTLRLLAVLLVNTLAGASGTAADRSQHRLRSIYRFAEARALTDGECRQGVDEGPYGCAAKGNFEGGAFQRFAYYPASKVNRCTFEVYQQPAALEIHSTILDFAARPVINIRDVLFINATNRSYEATTAGVLPPQGGFLPSFSLEYGDWCRWARAVPLPGGGYNLTFVTLGGSEWGNKETRCNPLSYAPNGPVASAAGPDWQSTPYCAENGSGLTRWTQIEKYTLVDPSGGGGPDTMTSPSSGPAPATSVAVTPSATPLVATMQTQIPVVAPSLSSSPAAAGMAPPTPSATVVGPAASPSAVTSAVPTVTPNCRDVDAPPFGCAVKGNFAGEARQVWGLTSAGVPQCVPPPTTVGEGQRVLTQAAALEHHSSILDFAPRPRTPDVDTGLTVNATEQSYEAAATGILPPEGGLLKTFSLLYGDWCRWARSRALPDGRYELTFVTLGGKEWADPSFRCNRLSYASKGPVAMAAGPNWASVPYCAGSPGDLSQWTIIETYTTAAPPT